MSETNKITLEAARINAKLTQREAAKQLGINVVTLISYEKGRTSPTWTTVQKMEKLYGINKECIFFAL